MRKRFLFLTILLFVISILVGCGGQETTAPSDQGAPSEGDTQETGLKIGVVTDVGEIDDKSFNQSTWEGTQAAAESIGAKADYIETQDPKDYRDNILEFVEDDYDVVVTVGFALADATLAAANEFPNIKFIGVDQFYDPSTAPKNVVGLLFHEDQAGYLAGVMAADLTTSGTIAAVLGTDLVPPVVAFKEGFEAGAKATKPDINIISTYHPGGVDVAFTDPEWGAATASQAIDQGADIVFGAGGKTGNGALIETAQREGMYCIGVDTDQWETVPEAHPCLVSSAVKRIDVGVTELIKLASTEAFPSGIYFGNVGLADFHDFDGKIPDELTRKLTATAEGLQNGSIVTGYGADGGDEESAETKPLNVGVVTDVGEIDDKSFNQSTWEGTQAATESIGGSADYIETQDPKDYRDNILEFAEDEYDVIVTVGFALGEATLEGANEFPNINFIGVDQFIPPDLAVPNSAGLIFHEDQAGYLAGVLAANLTKSGTIAAVLGTDLVPPVVAFKEGFEAGAKATKPDINIISTYHPGGVDVAFTDPEWGAATASQAIDQGADVVFGAGGKTGNGALIETAQREGMYCIGVDTDQWGTVPEAHPCLVSSAVKRIDLGVDTLIRLASQDKFPRGNYFGQVGLADFHDFDDQIPDDLKATLDEIAAGLLSGEISTGYGQ